MNIGKYIGGIGFLISSFTTAYFVQDYMNLKKENDEIQNKSEMVQSKKYEEELDYLLVCAQPLYDSEDILSETDEIELYFLEEEFNRISKEKKDFRGDKKIVGLETTIKANEREMKGKKINIFLSATCIVCFGGMVYSSTRKN